MASLGASLLVDFVGVCSFIVLLSPPINLLLSQNAGPGEAICFPRTLWNASESTSGTGPC